MHTFSIKMDCSKIILFFFLIFVANVLSDECTASQKNEMMACSAKFFEAQGFYENDGKNGQELLIKLAHSWDEFEMMCKNIYIFRKCLKPATARNCISKKHDKSKDGYLDISPHALYLTGDYVCGLAKNVIKSAYSCVTEYCSELETNSCYDFVKSMVNCREISKVKCESFSPKVDEIIFSSVFMARNCQSKMVCHLCPRSDILGQIMSYRSMLNFDDNTFVNLKEQLEDSDTGTQLKAIKEFQKIISTDKLSKESVTKNGFFNVFNRCLFSKSSEIQAEAAEAIKYLIDGTPENLEVMIESEIIPTLIRTLILTDENVLEKVIETLATIISKHPNLQNIYIGLNIVESLLMSYSPDISREMQHNIAQIMANLIQKPKHEIRIIIEQLIPCLSELSSKYNSKIILDTTKNLVKAAENDDDFKIDQGVLEAIVDLVDHQNEDISTSATVAMGYFFVNTFGDDYAEKLARFEDLDSDEAEEAFASLPEEDRSNMLKKIRVEL